MNPVRYSKFSKVQTVAQNENFYIVLPFISLLQLAGNRRRFKFGLWIEHSRSQPTDDIMPLKRA